MTDHNVEHAAAAAATAALGRKYVGQGVDRAFSAQAIEAGQRDQLDLALSELQLGKALMDAANMFDRG